MNKKNNFWKKIFGVDSDFWKFPKKINKVHKKVTLAELFFDIVIVVSLGGAIHEIITILEIGSNKNQITIKSIFFSILHVSTILLIWRAWTFYCSKHENDGMRHRFFILVIMSFIILSTLGSWISPANVIKYPSLKQGLAKTMIQVDWIGLAGAVFIIFYINLSVYLKTQDKYIKQKLFFSFLGPLIYSLVSIVIAVILMSAKTNIVFYGVGLPLWCLNILIWVLCDYLSFSNKIYANYSGVIVHHVQERYSILFIVFAGEMLLNIIARSVQNMMHDGESVATSIINMLGGFLIVFAFWYIFDMIFNTPDVYKRPKSIFAFSMFMLFIFIALIWITVGLTLIIDGKHHKMVNGQKIDYDFGQIGRYTLFSGIGFYTLSQMLVHIFMKDHNNDLQFAWPRWFQIFLNLSPVKLALFSVPIWFKDFSSMLALWIVVAYIFSYLIAFVCMQYWLSFKKDASFKFFKQEIKRYQVKKVTWIKKHIAPHIDYEHHKAHDFNINEFSQLAKHNQKK